MLMFFKKKITFTITVYVEPDDGRYHAFCPALKGLHAEGNTEDEACKNAVDAAIAYLKSLIKHGDPIPLSVIYNEETYPMLPTMATMPKCVRQIPVTV